MTEYAQASFDVEAYLVQRPRYPQHLYDRILEYHRWGGDAGKQGHENEASFASDQARKTTLLDLGCGPGQGSWPLLGKFDRLIGVDPSLKMIEQARQAYSQIKRSTTEKVAETVYQVAKVENLQMLLQDGILKTDSVDCVVAATAAHWFDMPKTYAQLAAIVRKNATVALWTYDLAYPERHASTAAMVMRFAYDDLSAYVDAEPCKRIRSLYAELAWPDEHDWYDVQYFAYPNTGKQHGYTPILPIPSPQQRATGESLSSAAAIPQWLPSDRSSFNWDWDLCTQDSTTWTKLAQAKRTNSSYYNWKNENPNVLPDDDIAAQQVSALRQQVLLDRSNGIGIEQKNDEEHIDVMRPMGLLLFRKR